MLFPLEALCSFSSKKYLRATQAYILSKVYGDLSPILAGKRTEEQADHKRLVGRYKAATFCSQSHKRFPTPYLCEWIRAEKIAHFRRNHHRCHLCQSGKPEGNPISTDTSFAVFSSTSARSAASCSVGKEAIRQTASGNSHTSDCLYVHLQSTRFNGWMLLITGDFRCQSNYKGCSHSSAVPDTIQK